MKYRKVIRMKELEQEYGFCARTIQKAVVSNVGVTPKQLNLQICLQNAIQTLAEKPDLSLTDLTYQMQFYDQSHFGSVFRRMTGVCPGQYQKWLQTEKEGEKCVV
jgi:AraC-like DNA-binding protein